MLVFHYSPFLLHSTTTSLYTDCSNNLYAALISAIFKLGEALEQHGHEVQYFGMEHEGRCVGNRVNAYTSDMDFHGGSKLSKLTYPIKTIYSKESRVQLRKVLDDFKPDVCPKGCTAVLAVLMLPEHLSAGRGDETERYVRL